MAKRRRRRSARRRKRDDLLTLIVVGGIGYVALQPRYGTFLVVMLGLVVLVAWVLFAMPTWCDYDVGGRGCTNPAYGKFNGCWRHSRLKRDAMWAAVGRRNPGMAFRLMWTNSNPQPGRRVGPRADAQMPPAVDRHGRPISEGAVRQGAYNVAMLTFTVLGALGTIIALFLPK